MKIDERIEVVLSQSLTDLLNSQGATAWRLSKNDRFCNSGSGAVSVWPEINVTGRKVGYARVSTKDQKLRMQRDGLLAVGCEPIFKDHGVSGAKGQRPGLDEALEYLRPGDSLVVFKLDRLGRSVLHLADLLTRFQKTGIHFCSMSEGINTTTPSGKMVFHILSAVAEFHRDLIVENTIAGLDAARAKGVRLGRPPKLDVETIAMAHRMVMQDGVSIAKAAQQFGVVRSTLKRGFERIDSEPCA